ncbi:MAG: iron-sulfur cluster assembly accessory protein [Deltaproteobacteria bacterium]|nr:iron-sulfur cluster assembly accessory protein [Deltaproteobacteria bacterium]
MAIAITPEAQVRIRQLMAKRPEAKALRLGVRGGGCSGFSYVFELDLAEAQPTDKVFEHEGFTVYVDQKSYFFLNATELDFVDELMGQRFKFNNPNVTSTCGCGESVSF